MTIQNYVRLQDLKDAMPNNDVATTTKWDTYATTLCTNLSRAFDTHTWREPGAYAVNTADTRLYDGIPSVASAYNDLLAIDEIAALPTVVSIAGNVILSTDFWGFPYNSLHVGKPFTFLRLNPDGVTKTWGNKIRSISVTALFGYSQTTPPDVYQALISYVARFLRKAQQNFLETGTFLDTGQVLIMSKRDEDLTGLIERYRKPKLTGTGYFS